MAKRKDNLGSSSKSAPFYVKLKGKKYPGYPKLPLMADARKNVQEEVKKQEKILKNHIDAKIKRKDAMKLSKRQAGKSGRRDRTLGKADSLGFSVFFDNKAFEHINKFYANEVFEAGKAAIKVATIKGIATTKDEYFGLKSATSKNTKLKSKWITEKGKHKGDIYETLADSLGYYDKKEGIKTKYIPTLPISQMASIQVGSFDKNVNLEVDGKVNTPTKPTGVFGSRDERKRKSLTQLYSKRVYSFSRKSSPLAGSMKSRLKGRSNVTMGDL